MVMFGLSNTRSSQLSGLLKTPAKKFDVFVIVYLDDILIYTEDPGQAHVKAVCSVLENLRRRPLANLKKCRFHQDEVRFLSYVVSPQGVSMKDQPHRLRPYPADGVKLPYDPVDGLVLCIDASRAAVLMKSWMNHYHQPQPQSGSR